MIYFGITEKDKEFLKRTKSQLEPMLERWIDELRTRVFDLPKGEERDNQITMVKFLQGWLNSIYVANKKEEKKETNKDFI